MSLLPNGYVMQSKNKIQKDLAENPEIEHQEDQEESRVFTSKSMIRYMTNGRIEIMYANGNFAVYDPNTDLWTTTNNKGMRRTKRQSDGDENEIEAINSCMSHLLEADMYTKEETDARVLFKEDNVISVLFPNGARYTAHHDGTKIISNHDGTEIVFEKFGYSLVKVLSGRMLAEAEKVKNMDGSEADIEFYDSLQTSRSFLMDRIKDGQIIQTYLHDKSVIQSFVEVNEFGDTKQELSEEPQFELDGTEEIHAEGTNEQEVQDLSNEETKNEEQLQETPVPEDTSSFQGVHLIRRQDLSVTKVTSDGEICIISGPTRAQLNKRGNLMKMGKDYDYLIQLFDIRSEEKKGGIFICSLDKHNIITHDSDRNFFAVNSNGTFEKVLAPEVSEVDVEEEHQEIFEEDMAENEFEDASQRSRGKTVMPKVEVTKSKSTLANVLPVAPRIFKINTDGNASEFLTKERMLEECSRFTYEVSNTKSTEFIGQNPVLMHSYFKQLKTSEEMDEEYSIIAAIQSKKLDDCILPEDFALPKNVEEYQLMFRPIVEKPKTKVYLYRNFMQHKDFDHFKSTAFFDDTARYKKWKSDSEAANSKKFGLFEKDQDLGDRSIDKRIMIKIYRERQIEKVNPSYKQIRDMRIKAIANTLLNIKKTEPKTEAIKVEEQSRSRREADEIVDDENADFQNEAEGDQSIGKAPEPVSMHTSRAEEQPRKRTQIVMEEIGELQKEPYFLPNYFETHQGKDFIVENPPKAPNEEMLMRMSQRMSRSIGAATENGEENYNDADRISQYTQNRDLEGRHKSAEHVSQPDEVEDNAIVALEPEDDENQDQMRMSGMGQSYQRSNMNGTLDEPNYVPSMYIQEKDFLQRKDDEHLLKAEEYHVSKTKEFSVYGKLRPLKLKVRSLAKSNAKSEMNEKFITTESITDNRIKISSMANRAYLHAPSVAQVRKQGQHQMILQAITKKQTFNELISQANAMVTSVLNDPLKRSVNILPSQAKFGSIKEGTKYEINISCKNEDVLPQRIVVRQGKDPRIKIVQDNGGPVAVGMIKNIRVVINTSIRGDSSVISDTFEIMTKTDIYKIPITATVLTEDRFDEINEESFKIHNRSAMRCTVREVVEQPKTKVKDMLKKIEGGGWLETTGSESKLPSLPNIKNRAFEPDEQKELDEVMERNSRVPSRRDSRSSRMSKGSRMSNRG